MLRNIMKAIRGFLDKFLAKYKNSSLLIQKKASALLLVNCILFIAIAVYLVNALLGMDIANIVIYAVALAPVFISILCLNAGRFEISSNITFFSPW